MLPGCIIGGHRLINMIGDILLMTEPAETQDSKEEEEERNNHR